MAQLLEQQAEAVTQLFRDLCPVTTLKGERGDTQVPTTRQLAAHLALGRLSTEERLALVAELISEEEPLGGVDEADIFMGAVSQLNGGQAIDSLLATVISSRITDPTVLSLEGQNLDAFELRIA